MNERPQRAVVPDLFTNRCCKLILRDLLESFDQDLDKVAEVLDVDVQTMVEWLEPSRSRGLQVSAIRSIYERITANNLWGLISFSRFIGAEGLFDDCLSQFTRIHTDQYSIGTEFRVCSVMASKMAAWLKDVTPLPIATVVVSASYEGSNQTTIVGGFFNHPFVKEFAMVFQSVGSSLRPKITTRLFDANKQSIYEFHFPLGDSMAAYAVQLIQQELENYEKRINTQKRVSAESSSRSKVSFSGRCGGASTRDGRAHAEKNSEGRGIRETQKEKKQRFGRTRRISLAEFCDAAGREGTDFTDIDSDG